MNFYISDLHFGHKNIASFDNRPFKTPEKNDNLIIENWNRAVGFDDDVYILGDVSQYNSTKTIEIIKNLNGRKHLIRGNHDNKILKNPKMREQFVEICDYKEITTDDGKGLILCHYPIVAFKNHYYGWIHFYGHVHNSWEYDVIEQARLESIKVSKKPCCMFNVGVMMPWMDYTPKTFTQVIKTYNDWYGEKVAREAFEEV